MSETPFFCGMCHNMKVYVDSWKSSSHRQVDCIECHYKPGLANHLKGKWQDGQLSLVYFVTGKSPTKTARRDRRRKLSAVSQEGGL